MCKVLRLHCVPMAGSAMRGHGSVSVPTACIELGFGRAGCTVQA